jgi:Lon protease-like protein
MSLDEAVRRIPVFALPNAVLLPEATVALRVFEDRYRLMVREVLSGNRLLVIALLKPGWQESYFGVPPLHRVACVGEIVEYELPADDIQHILVRGIARVQVEKDVRAHPYRLIQASLLPEPPYSPGSKSIDKSAHLLQLLVKEYLRFIPGRRAEFERLLPRNRAPGVLADLAAAYLINDVGLRQRVLAAMDLKFRLSIVNAALASVVLKASFLRGGSYDTPANPTHN